MFGKRILILVAHPDDEVVAQSASITRAKADGAEIFALYLTHGCIAKEVMWRWERPRYDAIVSRRLAEGEEAARRFGIIPVGWSCRPARHLWSSLPQVFAEVQAAILECKPDQVWVPAYEGGNPDHDGLNAIGAKLKTQVSVLEFAEYNFFGDKARAQSFISSIEGAQVIQLTAEENIAKCAALEIYNSERGNLGYVGTSQESYRTLATYDYTRPPHEGTLWYTRFQWVPFKHPRVDFTDPRDVSKAIVAFLK